MANQGQMDYHEGRVAYARYLRDFYPDQFERYLNEFGAEERVRIEADLGFPSSPKVTVEEAALVRRVLATTGYTAPMRDRHEARRIVDKVLPAMADTGRGRGEPMSFGDAANC